MPSVSIVLSGYPDSRVKNPASNLQSNPFMHTMFGALFSRSQVQERRTYFWSSVLPHVRKFLCGRPIGLRGGRVDRFPCVTLSYLVILFGRSIFALAKSDTRQSLGLRSSFHGFTTYWNHSLNCLLIVLRGNIVL